MIATKRTLTPLSCVPRRTSCVVSTADSGVDAAAIRILRVAPCQRAGSTKTVSDKTCRISYYWLVGRANFILASIVGFSQHAGTYTELSRYKSGNFVLNRNIARQFIPQAGFMLRIGQFNNANQVFMPTQARHNKCWCGLTQQNVLREAATPTPTRASSRQNCAQILRLMQLNGRTKTNRLL